MASPPNGKAVLRRPKRLPGRLQQASGRIATYGLLIAVVLAAGGFAVIREANYSRADIPIYGKVPEFTAIDSGGMSFGPERMTGSIWVWNFVYTGALADGDPALAGMADLYERSHHTASLRFASIAVGPRESSEHPLADYPLTLTVTDPDWVFLWTESVEPAEALFGYLKDIPVVDNTRYVLIDAAGRVRGLYTYDNDDEIELLIQHLRELIRSGDDDS